MDYIDQFKLVKQGAEAKLYKGEFLGMPAIIKERFIKKYRHPNLDELISKERLKAEAKGMLRCKMAGVRTPAVYLVDSDKRCIIMEYIDGITIKDYINNIMSISDENSKSTLHELTKKIGESLGKMHSENIIHGDLTTSNMLIVNEKDLYLIDFGLSFVGSSTEDKGVDLYVLERAVVSTHPGATELFNNIIEAYREEYSTGAKEVLIKYEEVKARGRKRTMVG